MTPAGARDPSSPEAARCTVLVADDCADALALMAAELEGGGHRVLRARDGAEAWDLFEAERPDAVVSDVRMPACDGFELLKRIRGASRVPLLLITAYAEVAAAVSAVREGADDYLCFPEDLARLEPRVRELVGTTSRHRSDAAQERLAGVSQAIEDVRRRLRREAGRSTPVVFRGEPGSGRANAARALHALGSPRIPLLELGEADPDPQTVHGAILLRDFERFSPRRQRRWVTELHRTAAAPDPAARLLITTTPTPAEGTEQAPFHPQIWRRVAPFQIEIPSLEQRPEDVPALAADLANRIAGELGLPPVRIAPSALEPLAGQRWPRQVDDLRRVLDRAVAWSGGGAVTASAMAEALRLVATQRHEGLARRRAARQVEEREELIALLDTCGGNVAEMARRLGLTRGAVVYRLKKHGLAP